MGDPAFARCLRETLLRLDLGETLESVLDTLADPQRATVPHLINVLRDNQVYEHLIRKTDLIKKRKSSLMEEDDVGSKKEIDAGDVLPRTVALLGKLGTRNAVIVLRLKRILGVDMPKTEGDIIPLDMHKTLRHAIEIEDFSLERRIAHPDMNFAGGLLYDWLERLAAEDKALPKAAVSYLDEVWKQSIRTAQLAYHMGSALRTFKYHKYGFASGLTLQVGRFLMACLFPIGPSWLDFLKETAGNKLDEFHPLFLAQERKTFPFTHAEFSALVISFFPPLRAMEKAIAYYQEPYILRTAHPDLFRLSVILSVAHRLSYIPFEQRKIPKPISELLTRHQIRWLKEIQIGDKVVLDAIRAVQETTK